jgi:hypothetical protein
MSDMKLIMEGWRQYIAIHESASGTIILFEGGSRRRVEFRRIFNEVDDNKIGTFITEWERSVDYQLSEGAVQDFMENPVLTLSHQAFMLLDRVKDKAAQYASKIISVVNKIRSFAQRFEEEHPTVYRIGVITSKILLALLVVLALAAIFSGEAQAADLVKHGAGDPGSDLIATGAQLEKLGTVLQSSTDPTFQGVSAKMLQIASAPENITPGELGPLKKEFMEILNVGLENLQGIEEAKELAAKAAELAQTATKYAGSDSAYQVLDLGGTSGIIDHLLGVVRMGGDSAAGAMGQLKQMASHGTSLEVKELAKAALESLP